MGADRMIQSGTRETTDRFFGLGRVAIALATAPIDWVEFRRVSGVDPKMAKGMAVAAWDAQSDPELWRVSFEPVEREAWLSVERWDGARWVAIEPRRAA
jgi:hypothetical protein